MIDHIQQLANPWLDKFIVLGCSCMLIFIKFVAKILNAGNIIVKRSLL